MKKPALLLVGAGGHARSCIDVIEQAADFAVAGLVGMPDEVGLEVLGYPVLGTDKELPSLLNTCRHALVAAGQIKTPALRTGLFELLEQHGFVMPVIVSPYAYVSPHAQLGAGSIVMHGAIINAGAVVGKNCILNSQSLVEHDAVVQDHCHISTAARINGGVHVGSGSFIGSGAIVRQGVRIGENCLIGMGERVLADCAAGTHTPQTKRAA